MDPSSSTSAKRGPFTTSQGTTLSLQPVRTYQCPPADRPLYTAKDGIITIQATDAHASYWPTVRDASAGLQTWYEVADESSRKKSMHWKREAGRRLAEGLGLEVEGGREWTLAEWPEGYKMFVKHKRNDEKLEYCIAGSTFIGNTRKFITYKEFSKHLLWLCKYGDSPAANCECKHCQIVYEEGAKPLTSFITRVLKVDSPAVDPARREALLERQGREAALAQQEMEEDQMRLSTTPKPQYQDDSNNSGTDDAMEIDPRESTTPKAMPAVLQPVVDAVQPALDAVETASTAFSFKVSKASASVSNVLKNLFNGPQHPVASLSSKVAADIRNEAPVASSSKLPSFRPMPATSALSKIVEELRKDKGKGRAVEKEASPSATQKPAGKDKKGRFRKTAGNETVSPPLVATGKRKRKSVDDSLDADFEMKLAIDEPAEGEEAPAGTRRSKRARKQVNYAPILEPPPPPKLPEYKGPFVHKERHDDLAMAHTFPYRLQELVWVVLETPIPDVSNPDIAITHWPGIIKERKLNIETKVYWPAKTGDDEQDQDIKPDVRPRQTRSYTVQLSGIDELKSMKEFKNSRVLPYSAYNPPAAITSDEQKARLKDYSDDPPIEDLKTLEQSLTVFAFAQQIARHVRRYYSFFGQLTDPGNKRLKKRKKVKPARTVRAREKQIDMLEARRQFYQCLWWGAEKIWVGEMVRLNGVWETDASGNALMKRPSRKAVAIPGAKLDPQNVGRPVLFVLTHILREPNKKQLRFMGNFYQLRDIDNKGKGRAEEDGDQPMSKATVSARMVQRYLPTPPIGKKFSTLEGVPENEDFEFGASLLAGRYYDYDSTYSDRHTDDGVRRTIKTLAGKPTKRIAHYVNQTPEQWTVDRADTYLAAAEQARADMVTFFAVEALRKQKEGKSAARESEIRSESTMVT